MQRPVCRGRCIADLKLLIWTMLFVIGCIIHFVGLSWDKFAPFEGGTDPSTVPGLLLYGYVASRAIPLLSMIILSVSMVIRGLELWRRLILMALIVVVVDAIWIWASIIDIHYTTYIDPDNVYFREILLFLAIALSTAAQVGFSVTCIYLAVYHLSGPLRPPPGPQESAPSYDEMHTETSISMSTTRDTSAMIERPPLSGTVHPPPRNALTQPRGRAEDSEDSSSSATQEVHQSEAEVMSTVEYDLPDTNIPKQATPPHPPAIQPPFVLRQSRSRLQMAPRPPSIDGAASAAAAAAPQNSPGRAGPTTPRSTDPPAMVRRTQLFELWEAIEEELDGPTSSEERGDMANSRASSVISEAQFAQSTPLPAEKISSALVKSTDSGAHGNN